MLACLVDSQPMVMVTLTISSASKPPAFARGFPLLIEAPEDATVADVKASIAAKYPKFYASRQKISLKTEKAGLKDDKKLKDVFGGKVEGGELQVKDLGPQVSWTTVFLAEYCGPLLIHPLFYHLPRFLYGQDVQHSMLQKYVYVLVLLHFAKRELETIFVHRFSNASMPFMNIFKNSIYYHFFGGLLLAYDIYRPAFSATSSHIAGTIRSNEQFLWICTGIWAFAELSNLHTHLTLRSLRPANTRTRGVPVGYGFTFVSCPNYFFESMGWAAIAVMTGSVAAWAFTVMGAGIMSSWALKKHRNYRKEFGAAYPKGRKAIIPFIL